MKKRIISAVVALIILVPLIIIGRLPFLIGIVILSCLAFKELLPLMFKNKDIPLIMKILGFISVVAISLCQGEFLLCISCILIFIFMPIIFTDKNKYNIEDALKLMGSIILIGFIFYTFSYVREISLEDFVFTVLISTMTDTFAYVGGRLLGKHKLIPSVSPNKTIEGSIIGTLVCILVCSVYYVYMVNPGTNILLVICMIALLSIMGQLGDLLFSSIKRHYDIKDFSNIMPGHGGVLDRLDSLSIISIVYIIIRILI